MILLVFSAYTTEYAYGQDITLYSGLSQAAMGDMRDLRYFLTNQVPVNYRYTRNFPPYWRYGIAMRWFATDKYKLGIYGFLTSTGSRATYEDYSGRSNVDQALRCYGFTIHNEFLVQTRERSELCIYADAGVSLISLELEYYLQVGNEIDRVNWEFYSSNELVEGGVLYKYFIGRQVFIEGRAGIQVDFGNSLKDREDDEPLYLPGGELKADWSGVNILAGIGIRVPEAPNKK